MGHTVCGFPTWRLWPVMGCWGSSCGHRHRGSRLPMWGWEMEWFPWKQAAVLLPASSPQEAPDLRPCPPPAPPDLGSSLINPRRGILLPPPQPPGCSEGPGTGGPPPTPSAPAMRGCGHSVPPPRHLASCAHCPPGSSVLWPQLHGDVPTVAGQAGCTAFLFNPCG